MKSFEEDVIQMIENIQFRNVNDQFLNTLESDKRKMNTSPNVFIPADKTRNIYEMNPDNYNKLLTENITKTYKLAEDGITENIKHELKDIAEELKIRNRVEPMAQKAAFISLKDHKEDFENHTKCRLINPAKSDLGKVSKCILDKINAEIREQTHAKQWQNSDEAIAWFSAIHNKNKHTFLSFDIVDFYPSITENLLDRAITWGKQFTAISDNNIRIIKHARKSLLFHNNQAWTKKDNASTFDVTMGSYDGAEASDLVGLYILHLLEARFGMNLGLYRDDGLATIATTSGRLADKARKELTAFFETLGLKITAIANQKSVNFLDITFDLTNGTYKPYRKPNDEPLYINRLSNHPPAVIRQLPSSINKRINKLSCNQETFNAAAPLYNDALKRSNFNTNLTYETGDNRNHSQRRNRRRNVIWYNPPYSKNVRTNIEQDFLQLIDKHFPPSHKLNRLFNRHTVRVSYSCVENMENFIRKHNNRTLTKNAKHNNTTPTNNEPRTLCNCRRADECPIPGNCLAESVIYRAEVTTNDDGEKNNYLGITANKFKLRYRNHKKSFRNQKYANDTELSKNIWKLKTENRDYSIKWHIVKHVAAYKAGSRQCNLCLEEKLLLMKAKKKHFLNKRSEFFSKCRHVTKHLL